jgi:ribonuclease BN (tRNA processing enzyme)
MARIELQILGSGDALGSGGRFQACLRLAGPSGALLVDCGASSLVAMKRLGVEPLEIGWIVVSHLHGDHFGGIPFVVLDGQFRRRATPLVLAGPPGLRDRVVAAMEVLFPGSSTAPRRFTTEFLELADRTPTRLGPAVVTAYGVEHASGAPAYALRIEYEDKIVAYSGDTQWTPALLDVARGADVFVCEAYFFEKHVKFQLDYRTLEAQRDRLACGRLVLTHMSWDMLGRLGDVEFECAHDGQAIVL